ncbi:MAG: PhnD/SsuA/transferrin family substrate-binding protein, partial [Dehalococcoidia bacterium]|nr:PhnD/SsuA/transferrin family substrate-binding protein [Dehalococcoidia bacterium]
MKRTTLLCGLLIAILSLMAFGCAKPATTPTTTPTPTELPEYLILAAPPAGMISYTQASGVAALISAYTPINCKVIAYTNEQAWIPLLVTGEVDLGYGNMIEPYLAYLGKPAFDALAKAVGLKGFPIRLIVRGDPLIGSFMVRGNSPVKTIPDLRGKIVNNMWPAYPSVHLMNQGLLANGGLTYDDVQSMPFPGIVPAVNAVMEGRCEAAITAIDAAFYAQAVAAVNARCLPLDPSPEAVKRMEQAFPGLSLVKGEKRATIPDLPEYLMAWDTA